MDGVGNDALGGNGLVKAGERSLQLNVNANRPRQIHYPFHQSKVTATLVSSDRKVQVQH